MNSEIKWQKSSFSGGGGEQCLELAEVAARSSYARATTPT